MSRIRLDLAGRRFGQLVVVRTVGRTRSRGLTWECRCDCGAMREIASTNLVSGNTSSCGCFGQLRRAEANTKHGMSETRIFGLWTQMMARCHCETNQAFDRYGGRGIFVSERWHLFENFYADMGDPPPDMTLDRRDNDGPYSPENCRWASRVEQGRNKRNNRLLTYRGEIRCMAEWCELLGLKTPTVCQRLNKRGWSVDRALSTPATLKPVHPVKLPEVEPAQMQLELVA